MAGFDKELAIKELSLPSDLSPVVVIAVGKVDNPTVLNDELRERELKPRSRKELSELVLNWNQISK
jgi:hypothetical protein